MIGDALGLVALQDDKPFQLVETKGNLGYHGSCTVAAKLGGETDGEKKNSKFIDPPSLIKTFQSKS